MNKTKPAKNPSLLLHTASSIRQEFEAWGELVRTEWKWILTLALGAFIVLTFTRPLPPDDVYLAVGQEGSTFDALGKKLVPYFAEEGIRLNLVNTPGSGMSLAELADKDDLVNAALLVGGISTKGSYPGLYSLGSVESVPLWLFYNGPEYSGENPTAFFANKRIAIGSDGSATEIMLSRILKLSDIELDRRENYLRIPHQEALQKLLSHEIDAMVILDGINSPVVKTLIAHRELNIMSWSFAPAYVKMMPFLDTVVIPKGSLDLKSVHPQKDILMLASSATLLVDRDLHPAVQQLFLIAMDKASAEQDQFFSKPDFFPAYVDHTIPLSPVAKRFYEQGGPVLRNVLPLWVGSYIDRMWLVLVGAIATIYPLFKLFPSYRSVKSNLLIEEAYIEIQRIDKSAAAEENPEHLQALLDRIDAIDVEMRDSRISTQDISKLYSVRGTLRTLRQQIADRKGRLESEIASRQSPDIRIA